MDSNVRNKQIRDVLEADGQYNRMVFNRVREASKAFTETTRPKTLRDEEKEVNIDILVEKMDALIKKKISSLQYYAGATAQQKREAYSQVTNYSDLVSLYNNAVRIYNDRNLNMTARDNIATKIQRIATDIDVLVLSLDEYINGLLNADSVDKMIVSLIQALSAYNIIRLQLKNKGGFNTISVQDITSYFNNFVLSLPSRQRDNLSRLVDLSKSIKERALNVPAFQNVSERIKEKEAELNIKRGRDIPTVIVETEENIAKNNQVMTTNTEEMKQLEEEMKQLEDDLELYRETAKTDVKAFDDEIKNFQNELKRETAEIKDKQAYPVKSQERKDKGLIINGLRNDIEDEKIEKKEYIEEANRMIAEYNDKIERAQARFKLLEDENTKLNKDNRKLNKDKPKRVGKSKKPVANPDDDIPDDNEEPEDEEEQKGAGKFLQMDRYKPSQPLLFNDKKNNSYRD
jgi:hypothetical protein